MLIPSIPESTLPLLSPEDRSGTVSLSPSASCIELEDGAVGEMAGGLMNGLLGDCSRGEPIRLGGMGEFA